ncbi:MAG: thioredoxin domain-containing protein [Candidatus Dormibacteria bacterium]
MNRLAQETSLYLRQHQSNPVDWYPWGQEAFARAREEDRPILLSVGYSSCHWCHVMAHDCFEDERLASLQNRLFVSIKVDREERPDVDRVYMAALQALTGSGGWPMTLFLLPDGRPFYGGTYFPSQDRHGLPGFGRVLESVAEAYRTRHQEAARVAQDLTRELAAAPEARESRELLPLAEPALRTCSNALAARADPVHGGFGGAPKFPQAPLLEFLLTRAALTGDERALAVARQTLEGMAKGGIQDQLEGGFHRYSVDDQWAVPHFEKMLYDQAQLIACYLHLGLVAREPEALHTARRTADFALAELRLADGGFAASLDADTPAGEGATYLWSPSELEAVAGDDQAGLAQLFRLDPKAMVDHRLVLQAARGWGAPAADIPGDPAGGLLRQRLLEVRRRRPQPSRDEKVVSAWNAAMVSALSELGVVTGESRYQTAAETTGNLLLRAAGGVEGRLPHLVEGAAGRLPAQLEDLAQTGLAALQLHEASGRTIWFDWALALATQADREMRDPGTGLWFDIADGQDPLLMVRPMGLDDGAVRSGNSLMVELCLRLSALTGDPAWLQRAEAALGILGPAAVGMPAGMGGLMHCAQMHSSGMLELAIVTEDRSVDHLALVGAARLRHRPNLVVAVGRRTGGDGGGRCGPPLAKDRDPLPQGATAFVCHHFTCLLPTCDPAVMTGQLESAIPA